MTAEDGKRGISIDVEDSFTDEQLQQETLTR